MISFVHMSILSGGKSMQKTEMYSCLQYAHKPLIYLVWYGRQCFGCSSICLVILVRKIAQDQEPNETNTRSEGDLQVLWQKCKVD